jgi:methionyl-tRNA formyltransferase
VDWNAPAEEIARRLRAFSPWPGLYTFLGTERLKLLAAETLPETGRSAPAS